MSIALIAKRTSNFSPEAEVILRGDEKILQNILQKLKIYRNLDQDLRQINPNDIQPAMEVLLSR